MGSERGGFNFFGLWEKMIYLRVGGKGSRNSRGGVSSGGREEEFVVGVGCLGGGCIPPIIRRLMVDVRDRGWVFKVLGQSDRADQGRKS